MAVLKGLEWTFDTAASSYEKIRPGYVDELYQVLFDYISIDENSNVVEVGSGGGQATAPVLKTGCKLTAVEYGEQFSELLREKFKEYPGFSVLTGKFEDMEFEQAAKIRVVGVGGGGNNSIDHMVANKVKGVEVCQNYL